MRNAGKIFEDDIKKSVPKKYWIYRLRDNASSFAEGKKTRFTSSNICDFIMYDGVQHLYLLECKSTKESSIPLSMIRDNQRDGLLDCVKFNIIAGLLLNFRNKNNDTFFLPITQYSKMINEIDKKSFNVSDLQKYGAIKIDSKIARTHYRYDIEKFINNY